MPPLKRIDSPKNPHLKSLVKLRERRMREREGCYLIEGTREVSRALAGGEVLLEVAYCPEHLREEDAALLEDARLDPVSKLELSPAAFEKLSYRENPGGVIATARVQERRLEQLSLPGNPLVLVIDGLEKPGNVGALLRTADGVGVDAVLISGTGVDMYNPNVIRASMGSLFALPVLAAEADRLRTWLEDQQIKLIAASPHAPHSYWEADYLGPSAIILGAEDRGLDKGWLSAAKTQVAIPMRGLADSLNVATAGALLCYEARRQRRRG